MGDGYPLLIVLDCLAKLPAEFRDVKLFRLCWFAHTRKVGSLAAYSVDGLLCFFSGTWNIGSAFHPV
jgi:hypothetical protein